MVFFLSHYIPVLVRRRAFIGCVPALLGGFAGCTAFTSTTPPESTRTQQPPTKVRASIPDSVDQTFDVTVNEYTEGNIKLEVSTTLTGRSETLTPRRMVLKFNEDNSLQDKAVISDPQFGTSITKTLFGKIGTGEKDVSLSSHTEFEPSGSLSLHYTKLLPRS